ncbi:N-alpha-acetyltransferase 80 [Bacillus rossius redtenbacheri]|uniref:N-alpha-acetyltransferase 80 n=1 Tax=Bacillus rossius redtenbacheri TaxID=93214 RepID=UPI002FDDB33C
MLESSVNVVKLHDHPSIVNQCCELLNSEWPRSINSRCATLRTSRDELPTCFCLVQSDQVIGHAKLSPLLSHPGSCTVHSVLIHPGHRKKGLGRLLMEKCEEYATSVGIHTIYLSTDDQQGFYAALGYAKCEPFSIYGSSPIHGRDTNSDINKNDCSEEAKLKTVENLAPGPTTAEKPPPPPPPPPSLKPHAYAASAHKTFMRKILKKEK